MQMRAAVAVVAVVTAALAGCTAEPTPKATTPAPTSTPVFASEAEALAAAEAAYRAYLAVSDQILIDGGRNPDRLYAVATPAAVQKQIAGYEQTAANGWVSTGGTAVDSVRIESVDLTSSTRLAVVVLYACVDVSAVDVFDADGNSVVSASRPDRSPFEATFDLDDGKLKLAGERPWTGNDFC